MFASAGQDWLLFCWIGNAVFPKEYDVLKRGRSVGYKFSLVLSREITEEESTVLKGAGCSAAVFGTDSLPTNADTIVTKMDFDDTISPTLAEAIESALEAVKSVPDLSVPGLTVPAQPAGPMDEESKVVAGEMIEEVAAEVKEAAAEVKEAAAEVKEAAAEVKEAAAEVVAEEAAKEAPAEASVKKTSTRKASPRKASPRKKVEVSAEAD
jgi:hypothetical protein